MDFSATMVIYLSAYVITIIYLVVLGCYMLFLLLAVWQKIAPPESKIPLYLGALLGVASYVFLLVRFAKEYRIYVRRIQSEYSDTTGRDIAWSWISFSGFAVQGILFVVYEWMWSPALEVTYHLFTILNFGYLCFCISRQRTIDEDLRYENNGSTSSPIKTKTAIQLLPFRGGDS